MAQHSASGRSSSGASGTASRVLRQPRPPDVRRVLLRVVHRTEDDVVAVDQGQREHHQSSPRWKL